MTFKQYIKHILPETIIFLTVMQIVPPLFLKWIDVLIMIGIWGVFAYVITIKAKNNYERYIGIKG